MGKIKELFAGRPCHKPACLLVKNDVAEFFRFYLDTKRQTEQRRSRSEWPKREDGFPARAPHSGADGRLASAPTRRRRTSRTSAALATYSPAQSRGPAGVRPRHPRSGKRNPRTPIP